MGSLGFGLPPKGGGLFCAGCSPPPLARLAYICTRRRICLLFGLFLFLLRKTELINEVDHRQEAYTPFISQGKGGNAKYQTRQ